MDRCNQNFDCDINQECIDNTCQNIQQTNENTLSVIPQSIFRYIISPFLVSNDNFDHLEPESRLREYTRVDNRDKLQNMIDTNVVTLQRVFDMAVRVKNYDLARRMYRMRNIFVYDTTIYDVIRDINMTDSDMEMLELITANGNDDLQRYTSISASYLGNIRVLEWLHNKGYRFNSLHLQAALPEGVRNIPRSVIFILTHTSEQTFREEADQYSELLFEHSDDMENFAELVGLVPQVVVSNMVCMIDNNRGLADPAHVEMIYNILLEDSDYE